MRRRIIAAVIQKKEITLKGGPYGPSFLWYNIRMLKKNAANIITATRILGTLVMIIMPVFSKGFYIAYTYAGLSDVADGFVARKFNLTSKFGARLDSFADLFFYISMMIKILPALILYLPAAVMYAIYSIFAFRMLLYVYVWATRHRFLSNHTYLNKATGFTLFFVPYLIRTRIFTFYASMICAIAVVAGIYEIKLLIKEKNA